jgi:hypothetical protein
LYQAGELLIPVFPEPSDAGGDPVKPLMDWLQYNGYRVVTKTVHEMTYASGRRKVRGSMHVELACDVMDMAGTLDGIYLFSSDGDYRALVAAVQRRGVRVSVVSSLRTPSPMISEALRRHRRIHRTGFSRRQAGAHRHARRAGPQGARTLMVVSRIWWNFPAIASAAGQQPLRVRSASSASCSFAFKDEFHNGPI